MFSFFSQLYDSLTGERGNKGLIVGILFIVFALLGLWLFESSTKTFQFQRLSREIETLSKATAILPATPLTEKDRLEVVTQRSNIIEELSLLRAKAAFAVNFKIPMLIQNFVMGMIFWTLFAFIGAKGQKDAHQRLGAVAAVLFLGILFSIGAAFLPRFLLFVGHALLYPIAFLVGFFLLVILICLPLVAHKKRAEQGAAANP